ncbi:LacI family DNA-binding transcriptional regulator [Streptomyces sp. NPDC050422]|uniref:LacI family DNA-binding transcriptional regulator n=1 Tax=Streptomyces sp. NPDC050422 TaxID=3365614 RepID=UPI003799E66C
MPEETSGGAGRRAAPGAGDSPDRTGARDPRNGARVRHRAGQASVTVKDIAALAGVTPGTVSRVVNGRPGVGPRMRARIEALIAEHGYRTDSSARQLSTGRSSTLAVVFPLQASEMALHHTYPELLGAIGDAADAAGHDLLLISITSPDKLDRAVDTLVRRRVDGVVLPAAGPRDGVRAALVRAGIPCVTIGHRATAAGSWWVDTDHDLAAAELTRRLIATGRRRLHLLNGPPQVAACTLRAKGFRTAAAEAGGVDFSESHADFDEHAARDAARALLSAPTPPTAVVAGSDLIAAEVIEAARSEGLRIPEDLAVTGFDDQPLARYVVPGLTTVRMPLHDLGTEATRILMSSVHDGGRQRRHLVLPSEIVVRGSTPPGF